MDSMVARGNAPRANPANIVSTLEATSGLNTLNSYINASQSLSDFLLAADKFTFLAPSDSAFKTWLADYAAANGNATPPADVIEATLQYHVLNGTYNTVYFTEDAQFAPTYLTNASYSNVTIAPDGQRVELIETNNQQTILSGNKTVSTVTTKDTLCLNGVIQVIDTVLKIPYSIVLTTADAGLSNFIAILAAANSLTLGDAGIIEFVNYASFTPNMTIFAPNTKSALDAFTNTSKTLSADDLEALFDYHIVPNEVLYSSDFKNGTILTTTQGTNLTMTTNGSNVYVNSALITTPDYLIVNGVIHVIDSLLDRFNTTIPPQPVNTTIPNSSAKSSGASPGVIGAAVVVPVVAIAAIGALLFWWRKRKNKKAQTDYNVELDTAGAWNRNELDGNPDVKELVGSDNPEMDGSQAWTELDAKEKPGELEGQGRHGGHQVAPVELE